MEYNPTEEVRDIKHKIARYIYRRLSPLCNRVAVCYEYYKGIWSVDIDVPYDERLRDCMEELHLIENCLGIKIWILQGDNWVSVFYDKDTDASDTIS